MTFSLLGFDAKTGDVGVAVQSKFPNVGISIPFAKAGVGAIATQSYCNTSFGPRGLTLLEQGATPEQVLEILVAGDANRDDRQVGVIDAQGRTATFTGANCFDWAGDCQGEHCSAQGNTLASPRVCEDMVRAFEATAGSLAERLIAALRAGQAAGGDRRGQQSAALLVKRVGGGYGGFDDRYVELSICDHATPIDELERLYAIHRLTYLRSDPEQLVPIEGDLLTELRGILIERGFLKGQSNGGFDAEMQRGLHDFMGWENYDARMRDDDLIDLEVLADMRVKHGLWIAGRGRSA